MYEQRDWDLLTRAGEIADFLGIDLSAAVARLELGFHANHAMVAEDFRLTSPRKDDDLLEWYMITESYIWELSAYHLDEGFNYIGCCRGIAEKLAVEEKWDVLVLGDGIGDLTTVLFDAGLRAVYHDLEGSKTAEYARFRHYQHYDSVYASKSPGVFWTDKWSCDLGVEQWDAVVALDFMEHLPEPEVAKWSTAVAKSLRPGGYFAAQNAFACGDNENGGSIPMHISESNHYERDWWPLLHSLGFKQTGDIWAHKS